MESSGSCFGRRRFQRTGFGLDRDVANGDNLPPWKKKMFDRIRNKSKANRNTLLQRLEQEKSANKHLSPNTKRKNANNTIDSFKQSLIEHEMKMHFNDNNNQNNNNNNTKSDVHNKTQTFNRNQNGAGGFSAVDDEDKDPETYHLNNEQYKVIFAEMQRYLEQTELSELRASWVQSLEENEKDQEIAMMEEVLAAESVNDPHIPYCPVCCKNMVEIEYLGNSQPVYSCLCGARFRPRDQNVSARQNTDGTQSMSMECDVSRGRRMLKALKTNLNSLVEYHSKHKQCAHALNFAVIDENGFLQAW
eukprot:CAMPEP_0202688456 /NCGR_PEP_ID=MMETSP1385-20130828/3970_1 /ASSEMBLY_ACC=CAM_ASM_000861 /TAXON_ID=933848 /ORGANISM="Elphidium margaritaceum" /LENGTH=303 /DNA_ID=CAMNT_0049343443 /DNA_START=48 /DNA_END=956 /DNA_ORIENTATION=+